MFACCSQTAVMYEAGELGRDGKPQAFRWTMLYDVIRQLHATPELICEAWSRSLDHNHGTASHFVTAMTAVCETFGLHVGHWLRKPPDKTVSEMAQPEVDLNSPSLQRWLPQKPVFTGNAEADKKAQDAYDLAMQNAMAFSNAHKSLTLDPLMGVQGMSKEERLDAQLQLQRARVATSQYRRMCSNKKVPMNSPIDTINQVMAGVELPPDAGLDPVDSLIGETIPLYTSCILANIVQVAQTYTVSALVQWTNGKSASTGEDQQSTFKQLGARTGLEFRERPGSGPLKYDSAWLRLEKETNSWKDFARTMIDGTSQNHTCKIFDIPQAGLKDLLFLMSTKDNERPCPEEPRMPNGMRANEAFTNTDGEAVINGVVQLKMRGIRDKRKNIILPEHEQVELPRHPYSRVKDVQMQRSLDYVLDHGRLPAIMSTISSSVSMSAPIKRGREGIELNLAAAISHTQLVAESVMRCSLHPGCEGVHEPLCRDAQPPDGFFSVRAVNPEDEQAQQNNPDGIKLPYSYDIVPISITLDAMSRYYDPGAQEYVAMYNEEHGATLGLHVKTEDLPHMSMRFVGMSEAKRRFLSVKVPEERSAQFKYVEAGNDSMEEDPDEETISLISAGLGHRASDEEIERYMQAKQGSRAMSQVRGDLFSLVTWYQHTATALTKRGMVSGQDDPVMQMMQDGPYQIVPRVHELASVEINKIVDAHPDLSQDMRRPGDELLSADKLKKVLADRAASVRRRLYRDIELPEHLDELRYCGPLEIRELTTQMTYANNAKKAEEPRVRENKRHAPSVVDRFKNPSKARSIASASKRPRNAHVIASGERVQVTSSGRRDARMR